MAIFSQKTFSRILHINLVYGLLFSFFLAVKVNNIGLVVIEINILMQILVIIFTLFFYKKNTFKIVFFIESLVPLLYSLYVFLYSYLGYDRHRNIFYVVLVMVNFILCVLIKKTKKTDQSSGGQSGDGSVCWRGLSKSRGQSANRLQSFKSLI